MQLETVVIGAGVVGLAVARSLALAGREVTVIERESAIGVATSSRNSGVIHAGIYYACGSLKANLCVRGKDLLYEYCERRDVPFRRCGKIIVATNREEIATLENYARSAEANGAGALRWLSIGEVAALEPNVRCVSALHSESTGIIDVHTLMQACQADIEAHHGQVVLRTALRSARVVKSGFELEIGDTEISHLRCRELVNSAGLEAPAVARCIDGLDASTLPKAYYARGHYYSLLGKPPFSRLVYPVAQSTGLGTHVTVDLAGRVRFGPDLQWIESVDYSFDRDRSEEFAAAIQRYYPGLDPARLQADYTGIRPRISPPGAPVADFRIDGVERHGVAGLVNLFGIESPGLTSALAIGEYVTSILCR
jgi:L-2-hydroxyglutarate oxidase LhgO